MSVILNEKQALAKLRAELEGRKGKLCFNCKKSGHLAQNCRNKEEKGKRGVASQNKFEMLSSRMMQCGVEEKVIRRIEAVEVECFKCGKRGHKCRWCSLWEKKKKTVEERVAHSYKGKAHQQQERRPVHPETGNAQERKLRRMEEGNMAYPTQGKAQQEVWRRSLMEELRKQVEEHCGKGVLEEVQLLELGWYTPEIVVTYNHCRCERKRSYVEDNRG